MQRGLTEIVCLIPTETLILKYVISFFSFLTVYEIKLEIINIINVTASLDDQP